MRYNRIKLNDIANGKRVNVSLFTQGCPHHCKGCFNGETWDFNGGKEFTEETLQYIIDNINVLTERDLSILGGEPLCEQNVDGVIHVCKTIKELFPDKMIYIWTGYLYENFNEKQKEVLQYIDVLVDGPFIEAKRDLKLKMKGSPNQRVIDVKKTLESNNIVLFC